MILSPLICTDSYANLKSVANPVIKVCGSLEGFVARTGLSKGSNHGRVSHAIRFGTEGKWVVLLRVVCHKSNQGDKSRPF